MSKEVRLFFSKSNQLAHRLRVGNEIQGLRKKLDQIKKNRKFHLEEHRNEATLSIGRRTTHSFVREEEIIGREVDKKEIIDHLLDSSSRESVSVVSILGMGGLGKTALAKLVYNDDKVKDYFNLKMWVCHGDPKIFDVDLIIKEILKSAQDECQGDTEMRRNLEDIENKSKDQLQKLLRKVLNGKKYLLVLDDLWNENYQRWLELQPLLMEGLRGSKILITTHNRSVVVEATVAKPVIHDLQGLSEDQSLDLFKKMAFRDGEESFDLRLKEIGREIVNKCGGVPLAIRTIGSLLYNKKENEWLNFKEHELAKIGKLDDDVMEVLKLSYDHLPSHLKHCFAYCALFPKDYVFDKQTMIQLWMAQGFIESFKGNNDLEETGDRYVSNLLCGSFLEVEEIDDDTNEVNMFKMHDLMHDLALKVAGDECKMININEGDINEGIRHVSFDSQSSSLQKVTSLFEVTKLRTFLSLKEWGTFEANDFPSERLKILSKLRHCRALSLVYEDLWIPPFLGSRLKHLRFLDASGNLSIQNLPDSITDLVNLQTLKFSDCENLTTLPRDLKKLVNLRHILIDGCRSLSHMPCGLNHLSLLQTLSQFIVQKMDHKVRGRVGSLDELGGLNRLAGFFALENLQFLQPVRNKGHLNEKQRLRHLRLSWSTEEEDGKSDSDELILWENLKPHPNLARLAIYSCMYKSPPSWLSSITILIELVLEDCWNWKYLPSLGELRYLRRLTLKDLDALEFVEEISDLEQSDIAPLFFPSLEKLILFRCCNLKGWWGRRQAVGPDQDHQRSDSHASFPKLLSMKISDCPQLNSMPHFPQIETLDLSGVSMKWLQQETGASTFIPLSKLEELLFSDMDLEHSTLETLLPSLINLKTLRFDSCEKLTSLSRGMQSLSSLQSLYIQFCEELDVSSHDDEHGTQWRSLAKLRILKFWSLSKLVALPEGIQHITTLESLYVKGCENLMCLPEWIGNFSSLQNLDVGGCSSLKALPHGISCLTSLKTLKIADCPTLRERCQRENGADWEKIAHLPCSREGIIEQE